MPSVSTVFSECQSIYNMYTRVISCHCHVAQLRRTRVTRLLGLLLEMSSKFALEARTSANLSRSVM